MNNPMQPLVDVNGTLRFKANEIVLHLLDSHPSCGMNELALMDFSDDDRRQFAQLIGYSLNGYSELTSYVTDESYEAALKMAGGLDYRDAKIAALEQKLLEFRKAIDAIRKHLAIVLEMHPDDLRPHD